MTLPSKLVTALALALLLAGCGGRQESAGAQTSASSDTLLSAAPRGSKPAPETAPQPPGVTIPAGTALDIALDVELTSETAKPGDPWSGAVKQPLVVGTAAPVPAGAVAHGTVLAVRAAERGKRAHVVLGLEHVEAHGRTLALRATTDTLWAGSTTTRDIGAVAGGTAVGALIGKVVGGNTGAVVGGVAGGTAAGVGVATAKGYQSRVEPGKPVTFHVREAQELR